MASKKIALSTGIATAAVALAIAAPGDAARTQPSLAWHPSGHVTAPDWLSGMKLRSEALNRRYGLGSYGLTTSSAASQSEWLAGLVARSDALNRKYHLGRYANGS